MSPQPGILHAPPAYGASLTFRLRPEADAATLVRRLAEGFETAWGVVGLGEPLVRAVGRTVPGLRAFPALAGPAAAVPSSQQALWVLVGGADRSVVFDRSRAVQALLAEFLLLEDSVATFTYREGRDLTGYVDGTANPSEAESPAVALATGPLGGSSFVAVQRWQHDLQQFRSHSQAERDAMMGRRLSDNEEMADAPVSAHVRRTAQELFEPPAFLVRRSMPWASESAQGLEFIAYGHSLDAFERQLRRMVGLDDGVVDALFRFSRPVTGGYYWCPPVQGSGRLDLHVLGA